MSLNLFAFSRERNPLCMLVPGIWIIDSDELHTKNPSHPNQNPNIVFTNPYVHSIIACPTEDDACFLPN